MGDHLQTVQAIVGSAGAQNPPIGVAHEYTMRISRLTVDKLGVKLYDKVSAVIAELISNSYDADARNVVVSSPMGQYLVSKAGGQISDKSFEISIEDDGFGMTPDEMQDFFLVVGSERRKNARQGDRSKQFGRKVMGRKGVGKLAPFGICKTIEVLSSGGEKLTRKNADGSVEEGFLTAHIVLDYDAIIDDRDQPVEPYRPDIGPYDGMLREITGTTISLRRFNYRKVPDIELLARQIAQRFGIDAPNWQIRLKDNTKTVADPHYERIVGSFDVPTLPNTRLRFCQESGSWLAVGPDGDALPDLTAGFGHDGKFYPLEGWVAYAQEPYKDDLMAGVRIYCRGKIAAQTNVFNRGAGFHGEHTVRSYLVGQLAADWLDEDEDLIQTDRRDILWSDELGAAFQDWGQRVVLTIGRLSRDPLRRVTMTDFFEVGRVEERAIGLFPSEQQKEIRSNAVEIARTFGRTLKPDEAKDPEVVKDLVDLCLVLAPHVTLDQMLRNAAQEAVTPLSAVVALLRTARIAELSSFGQIAEDRIKVIGHLEELKDDDETKEDSLQKLIEDAPWLINPEWAPITANQTFNRLKREFEKFYEAQTGIPILLDDFGNLTKRPDFVLSNQDSRIEIIEIKRPEHRLQNVEMDRVNNYHQVMDDFLKEPANESFRRSFHRGFHITLVCDGLALSGVHKTAFEGLQSEGKLTHINWRSFLLRTERVHQDFLNESKRQQSLISERDVV